jgi:HAD superfamily hydrolase (TIGR01509 family)
MTLAGLILDFDGLIVDTETPIFEGWQAAFRDHGQELTLDEWRHSLGTFGGFDPVGCLEARLGAGFDGKPVAEAVRTAYLVACQAQPLLPGVVDLLAEARALGVGVAVASSSTRAWVEGWLARHAIRERVDHVCGRDDVARVKPHPDLFLLAARRLGAEPAGCVVYEDSPNGIRAAKAAGMRSVAVPNGVTRALDLGGPDLVQSSLAERPLAEVARRLGLAVP